MLQLIYCQHFIFWGEDVGSNAAIAEGYWFAVLQAAGLKHV